MSVSPGGLGAFDVAVLPEVFVPVGGHGLSSDEWLAPRRRLLRELLAKGERTLWPDLDDEYYNALRMMVWGTAVRNLGEDAPDVLLDLLGECEKRRYPRLTDAMRSHEDLNGRSKVKMALLEAHSKVKFDRIIDCGVAMSTDPASFGGSTCCSVEDVCEEICRLDNAETVRLCPAAITRAVSPLACRFSCVTVTGGYIGPRDSEVGLPVTLLGELTQRKVSVLRKFRVEFEGRTPRGAEEPLSGDQLRHAVQVRYGRVLDDASKRGVVVEMASWPERTRGELLERHVVVGTSDEVHSGLTIGHIGRRHDGCDRETDIIIMPPTRLNRWNAFFREPEKWEGARVAGNPEVQAWPATR